LYADVIYGNGIKVSSLPVRVSPKYEGMVHPTDTASDEYADFTDDLAAGWQYPMVYVDPLDPEVLYSFVEDDEGNRAISLAGNELPFHLTTYKFIDLKWQINRNDAVLCLKMRGRNGGRWELEFVNKPGNSGQTSWKYSCPSAEGWHRIAIKLADWRNEAGQSPLFWHQLQQLYVSYVQGEEPADIAELALGRVWTSGHAGRNG
jgi:hypothetical protein